MFRRKRQRKTQKVGAVGISVVSGVTNLWKDRPGFDPQNIVCLRGHTTNTTLYTNTPEERRLTEMIKLLRRQRTGAQRIPANRERTPHLY